MRQNPKQQFKDKELSYKASLRVLEAVSILNAPNPSLQVINIVKENQNELPPVIQMLFNEIAQRDRSGRSLLEPPLIDDYDK